MGEGSRTASRSRRRRRRPYPNPRRRRIGKGHCRHPSNPSKERPAGAATTFHFAATLIFSPSSSSFLVYGVPPSTFIPFEACLHLAAWRRRLPRIFILERNEMNALTSRRKRKLVRVPWSKTVVEMFFFNKKKSDRPPGSPHHSLRCRATTSCPLPISIYVSAASCGRSGGGGWVGRFELKEKDSGRRRAAGHASRGEQSSRRLAVACMSCQVDSQRWARGAHMRACVSGLVPRLAQVTALF
jgi:hypothetical protein